MILQLYGCTLLSGILMCHFRPTGSTFEVDLDQFTDLQIPKEGQVVTFEYEQNLRHEIPVNPIITKIRSDLSWDNVMQDFLQDNSNSMRFFLFLV